MKKYLYLIPLVLLVSCNNNTNVETSISESKEDKSIESSSEIITTSSEESYIFDDSMFEVNSINLGVNESYPLRKICKSGLEEAWYEVDSSDWTIIRPDELDIIHALKEGRVRVTIYVEDRYYDFIDINVVNETDYIKSNYLDVNKLYQTNVTVFGTSISDNSVTAYPDNKPTFWTEMLKDRCELKNMFNHAVSGSTVGYSKSLDNIGCASISATFKIQEREVKKHVEESDYVFIFTGANDYIRNVDVGDFDDIDDENFYSYESFTGSYNYLIHKIKEINDSARIICMSTIPSTWGKESPSYPNPGTTFTNRKELNDRIKELADRNGLLYVYMYDVWKCCSRVWITWTFLAPS